MCPPQPKIGEIEAVLVNEEDNLISSIVSFIDHKSQETDILIFKFDNKEIADAIIRQHNKNSRFRLLIDIRSTTHPMTDTTGNTYPFSVLDYLYKHDVNLRVFDIEPAILHHKVILKDSMLLIGSANFFTKDLLNNHESILSIANDTTVKIFSREFNRLWKSTNAIEYENLPHERKSEVSDIQSPIETNCSEPKQAGSKFRANLTSINFSPLDFEKHLNHKILAGNDSILIQASIIRSTKIIRSLLRKAGEGTKIKILTNIANEQPLGPLNDHKNISIKYFKNPAGMLHEKTILIDKDKVLYGTVNMFERSLKHDQEHILTFEGVESYMPFYANWIKNWEHPNFN